MLPGALSHMEGAIFLRFLPLRHSISQHFIVLLVRHAVKRTAAVVEQGGDVSAGLPSLQVSTLRLTTFVEVFSTSVQCQQVEMPASRNRHTLTIHFMHIMQCIFINIIICSENGTYYYSFVANNWDTRNNSFSSFLFILHFTR